MLCILKVGTVPMLCILNVGTVLMFSHFLYLFCSPVLSACTCICLIAVYRENNINLVRGGVKIENQENLGQCPNFNLGILGGVSIFQKCSNFNYLIVYFAILLL